MKKPLLSGLTSVSACLLHFYDTLCLRKRSVGGAEGRQQDGRGCHAVCRDVSGEAKAGLRSTRAGVSITGATGCNTKIWASLNRCVHTARVFKGAVSHTSWQC